MNLNRGFEAEEIPVEQLLLDGIHPHDAGHRLVVGEVAPDSRRGPGESVLSGSVGPAHTPPSL